MTIHVEIPPEVQAELAAQARARGMDVPAYAATLLQQAAQPIRYETEERGIEEFENTLDRIAQSSHKMPIFPDEAFSRQGLIPGSRLMCETSPATAT